MQNFCPIVLSATRDMKVRQAKFPKCRRIRHQFFGDNLIGNVPLLIQEFSSKFMGRALVPVRLRQNLENLAFIVNGTPERCPLATYADKNLIEMPNSRRSNSTGSELGGNRQAEFQDLAAKSSIASARCHVKEAAPVAAGLQTGAGCACRLCRDRMRVGKHGAIRTKNMHV
jgi:hypothetical protein